jgi:hypothetical protein
MYGLDVFIVSHTSFEVALIRVFSSLDGFKIHALPFHSRVGKFYEDEDVVNI